MSLEKHDLHTQSRRQLNYFGIVVLLLSAVMIIAALVIQMRSTAGTNPLNAILVGCLYAVATSLISSIIVVYVSSRILGEPLDKFIRETKSHIRQLSLLNESAARTGLKQVFPRRADVQSLFFDLLQKRWTRLDIMAVKMEFLARDPRFEDYLISGCRRGAEIRLLLINTEDTDKLHDRAKYEARSDFAEKALIAVGSYRQAIQKCRQESEDTPKLELRGHDEYLPVSMIRVDDEMLYYSRTRNQRGAESPLYFVERVPGGIFDVYLRDFEQLWKKCEPTSTKEAK